MSAVRQQFWSSVQNFEENEIRTFFYAEQNLWLFSATDVWNTLNKNDEPNKNWEEIKQKLEKESTLENLGFIRIHIDDEWKDLDILQKQDILNILSYLSLPSENNFKVWLDKVCSSVPDGCYLSKNEKEYEFLSLASNRFLDLYGEINGCNFMKFSPEIRLYKLKDLFSVYAELLLYEPIKKHICFLEKERPPMESVLSNEFIKFIRNILIHFTFFKTWDEIYITKNLVNWAKEGQTIDKFLNKYKGNKVIEYRFMESKTRKWRYPTISFPRDYSNDKIYLKDMITEKDGVLLCAILMYRVVMSQIIEISYIDD